MSSFKKPLNATVINYDVIASSNLDHSIQKNKARLQITAYMIEIKTTSLSG